MKIVFMGTPGFSVGALKALVEGGYEVTAVVTQPDRPKGRGKGVACSPVKEYAVSKGIPVFQPVKIKTPEAVAELRTFEADLFVVAAFGQILSSEILHMPRYGCVNIHASLLPKYRGAAPIQWSIIDGEKETGVTIMQMDEGLDTGDMLSKCIVPILDTDTADSLHDKLMEAGASLLLETIPQIENGTVTHEKQNDADSCYAKMLKKEMGRLDFSKDAIQLERLIRGLNSWPGTFATLGDKTLKVIEARLSDVDYKGQPGEIVRVTRDAFYVACKSGTLEIITVQPVGKRAMSVHDYLLGYPLREGERLQ
ncbi:MAG: methionyl-tRNA formyltransferase [Lachnospiraceae bacterium]|nr:methionyl-tRNA formyltransferase [Lachnospiraceae bacterium]